MIKKLNDENNTDSNINNYNNDIDNAIANNNYNGKRIEYDKEDNFIGRTKQQ